MMNKTEHMLSSDDSSVFSNAILFLHLLKHSSTTIAKHNLLLRRELL